MRLIDADTLIQAADKMFENIDSPLLNHLTTYDVYSLINNAPTVEERPHGEWIKESSEVGALGIKYTWVRCNRCGWDNSLVIPKNFCPNCGAEMNER